MTEAHTAGYFRARRRALGVPERAGFPDNARIRKLAEELRTMEQESLEDFLRSYIRKPKKEERSCVATRYREES